MFLLIWQVCSLLMWLPGLLFWTYPILFQQGRLGTLQSHSRKTWCSLGTLPSHSRKTWCSLGLLIPEPHFSSVSVAGNVQGLALGFVLSVYCVCSLSGLQRHKSSCTGVGPSVDRTVEYSCNYCQQTFGEKKVPHTAHWRKKMPAKEGTTDKEYLFYAGTLCKPWHIAQHTTKWYYCHKGKGDIS